MPAIPTEAPDPSRTVFGAYGEGMVFIDGNQNTDWDLRRLVGALEHDPTSWLRFKIAAELENARRFGLEQGYIELMPAPAFRVRAGLLLLPLGIMNRRHEPVTFPTVDRPLTDQLIIPTTWRELGVGYPRRGRPACSGTRRWW